MLLKSALGLASPEGRNGRLSILIFHRVLTEPDLLLPEEPDVARFDLLMRWVAEWFNVLPLNEAIAALCAGALPPRAAAITFDDGYANGYHHALPVLQRYGLSATFFVATAFLDGGLMWNDMLIEAVRLASTSLCLETDIEGIGTVRIGSPDEKRCLLARLLPTVGMLPLTVRDEIVAKFVAASKILLPQDVMLSSGQLRALRAAGMLIGAHTMNHPCLLACSNDEAEHEIMASRAKLESILDEPVDLFAYPYGKPGKDYDTRHIDLVKKLGFKAALSTCWGSNSVESDLYQLSRFTPWDRKRWRFGLRMLGNFYHDSEELAS
ncbi:polysaccharide deacetylase [Betaproteobacteria bacterium]|nr:polysaccharide deacetylase [Betaproteobacteria bacterium]